MITSVEENYLKEILILSDKEGKASVNTLSKELGVKMPTVNNMMKRLMEKGYIHFEKYKPVYLTDTGRKAATLILRKHRLTETFLYEKMKLGWEQVHIIAEQIEHIQSSLFFDKMDEMLNFPQIDPHGEPIPLKNGELTRMEYQKLSDFNTNDEVEFIGVGDASDIFLDYLNKKDLHLGTRLKILSKETYDNNMVVSYKKFKKETLSHLVCEKMFVKRGMD